VSRFPGVDFMQIDDLLSEEERLVRDTVRAWVDERFRPIIEECNRESRFPIELVPEMAGLNLFGANIDEYDLPGLGNVAYGLIMQELECGDSGLRSFVSVQSGLVMYPIYTFGSQEHRDRWIPALASGEAIGCFGLTEPDFGSNPSGMRTTARRDGDGWVLNGAKQWITNGSIADVAVVWAQTDEGVRGFLVEKGTPGFTARDQHGKFSLRASITSELGFQDCRIPAANLLPETVGVKNALMCLNQARYGIAWGGLGAAMDCYQTALDYAKQRLQFGGQPIASHQLVQEKLVWMLSEISKGQLLALQLGRLKDAGKLKHYQVSLGKRNNVWVARECARLARDILGANGIVDDYPVIRHMMRRPPRAGTGAGHRGGGGGGRPHHGLWRSPPLGRGGGRIDASGDGTAAHGRPHRHRRRRARQGADALCRRGAGRAMRPRGSARGAFDRDIDDLTVVVLDRERHSRLIDGIRAAGARIRLIGDGDLSAGIAAAVRGTGIHAVMGIGGAPEGVITAAAMRCLGGEIQARLTAIGEAQKARVEELGITDIDRIYSTEELAPGSEILFAATGVTEGRLLRGVRYFGRGHRTQTLIMSSSRNLIRFVDSIHREDPATPVVF
jgi:glutaryl-CoA dehydrogenase